MSGIFLKCINDKEKPKEIPSSHWVKEDNEYELLLVTYHPSQKVQGCQFVSPNLEELKDCPYDSFKLDRFAIRTDDLEKFKEFVEDCNGLNDLDINLLLEQTQLELLEN